MKKNTRQEKIRNTIKFYVLHPLTWILFATLFIAVAG